MERVRWIENCLDCQDQRVVISNIKSSLSPVNSGIKLGGVIYISDSCVAIQRDLDRLEKWAWRKLMFNKGK